MFQTPKRRKLSTKVPGNRNVTPNGRVLKVKSENGADKEPVNGRSPGTERNDSVGHLTSPSETKRGRPRAESLNSLILMGSTSPSSIKCSFCQRVFPRDKSLQAHLRTHTGEKPYACDFPECTRQFAQSGQLKTHQRIHTGEKPFVCAAPNCKRRFKHANRHCSDHPDSQVKRQVVKIERTSDGGSDDGSSVDYDSHNARVREWLRNYEKRNKSNAENLDTTPKKSIFGREEETVCSSGSSAYFSNCSSANLTDDNENSPQSDASNTSYDLTPLRNSSSLKFPKKRWLREAVQDQHIWDNGNDLAHPLNWGEELCSNGELERGKGNGEVQIAVCLEEQPLPLVKPKEENDENQKRPSVLVCVQGGKRKEISSDEIQGAMALVELKNANMRI